MLKNFDQKMIESYYEGELAKYIARLEEKVNENTANDYDIECLEYAYQRQESGNLKSEKDVKLSPEDIKNIKSSVVEYKKAQRIEKAVRKSLG